MVQTIHPYVYIEPPDIEERPFGLFHAATPLTGVDGHWEYGGIEFDSLGGYQGQFYPVGINAAGGAGGSKTLPSANPRTHALPFAVYAGIECGVVGYTAAEHEARALRVLELSGQHAAENALWTGGGGNAPGLNASTTTIPTGGATASKVSTALRILEDWLGDNYNGRGFIHAKRGVSAIAGSAHLVKDTYDLDPRVVSTPGGTRWIFGAGYDGTGPNAVVPSAGQTWIYATGGVVLLRGEPREPTLEQAIVKTLNTVHIIAEQEYLITYDYAVAAALVDLTL
jgi:hypothetical protein